MKTVLAVLVTALITSSGAYAVERAVTPGQFNALKKQVATLQTRENAILGYIGACLGQWQPETQFNNFLAFDESKQQQFETSGIDLTASGESPSFYTPTASKDCTLQGRRTLAVVGQGHQVTATPQTRSRSGG